MIHDPVKEALRECVKAISSKLSDASKREESLEAELEQSLRSIAEAERLVEDQREHTENVQKEFLSAKAEAEELRRQLEVAKRAEANGFVTKHVFTDHGDMIVDTLGRRGGLTAIELRVAVAADHGVALTTREFASAVRRLIAAERLVTEAAGPSGRRHVYQLPTAIPASASPENWSSSGPGDDDERADPVGAVEAAIIRSLSTVSDIPADEIAVMGWGNSHAMEARDEIQQTLDAMVARSLVEKTEHTGKKPTYALCSRAT